MKLISLTHGRVAYVDDSDFDELSKEHWRCERHGNTYYAVHDLVVDGKKTKVYMHQVILGTKAGERIRHINRNGLDNRRSNIEMKETT